MSGKVAASNQQFDFEKGNTIFELRGYLVMLASKVADVFKVETREIVQNITRNNDGPRPLFPEHYAFQVNKEELEHLRSLGMISKPGRGGSRALPWVIKREWEQSDYQRS